MTANQAQDKVIRAQHYLRQSYGFEDAAVNHAYDILTVARYAVRDANQNRIAGRKEARKYGERCRMTIVAGFHPVTGIIDESDASAAVRLAISAAKNAFWGHPELRSLT